MRKSTNTARTSLEIPQDDPLDELKTPREAAKILRVSAPCVYKWAANGTLPSVRFPSDGRRQTVRLKLRDLLQLIQDNYQE